MTDPNRVVAAPTLDRSEPLGNSLGPDDRQRLHVKISQFASEPVPVTITDAQVGTPHYVDIQTVTTPGAEQTLISDAIPSGVTRSLHQVVIACRQEGRFTIETSAAIIGSGRTGASQPSSRFWFDPQRPIVGPETIVIKFRARVGAPITDVESHLQARDG